ncbi:MAG TPA: universal stress protein [Rubrobacteraceae bacterium]|nr:universal stress protein [Rubrobacteraceae bacterium]
MSFFPRKILLAIDGSEEAALATEAATELSKNTASEVHLTYVVPMVDPLPYLADEVREDKFEQAKKDAGEFLDKQAQQIRAGGGSVTEMHVRTGSPEHQIVNLGDDLGVGLIVIGSRGVTGMRRALMGSVSDSVVRHAHCPVLVVRKEKQ